MPELTALEIAESKAVTLADLLNAAIGELAVARAVIARQAAQLDEQAHRLDGLEK